MRTAGVESPSTDTGGMLIRWPRTVAVSLPVVRHLFGDCVRMPSGVMLWQLPPPGSPHREGGYRDPLPDGLLQARPPGDPGCQRSVRDLHSSGRAQPLMEEVPAIPVYHLHNQMRPGGPGSFRGLPSRSPSKGAIATRISHFTASQEGVRNGSPSLNAKGTPSDAGWEEFRRASARFEFRMHCLITSSSVLRRKSPAK